MKKPGNWVLAGSLALNLFFLAAWTQQRNPSHAGLDRAEFSAADDENPGHLRISFATPMDSKAETLPVMFSPALVGTTIWEDSQHLVFLPDRPLTPGLEVSVRPFEDAHDAAGKSLRSSQITTFTAPLRISATRYERITPSRLCLHFESNANIPAAVVLPHLLVSGATLSLGDDEGIVAEFADPPTEFHLRIKKTLRAPGADRGLAADVTKTVKVEAEAKLVRRLYSTSDRDGVELRVRMGDVASLAEAQLHVSVSPDVEFELRRLWSGSYSLEGDFKARQYYRVSFAKGMRFRDGRQLQEDEVRTVMTDDLDPVLDFVSRGPILPLSRSDALPIRVGNLDAVTVTARKVFPNNLVAFFRDGEPGDTGKLLGSETIALDLPRNQIHDSSLALNGLLGSNGPGVYEVTLARKERYWPRSTRTIVRTDLGISVAWGADSLAATVLTLSRNAPVANCALQVYSRQNQLLGSGETGANGLARVRLDGSDTPYLIVAEQGDDRAFLGLGSGYQHELSAFKMPTRAYATSAYEAYVYSERGVCRPGETITLNALLRDQNARAAGGFPIELRVLDPKDAVFHRETLTLDADGFASVALPFPAHVRTGGYRAEFGEPGGETWGHTRFNVAHYQPDRMRNTLTLNGTRFGPGANLLAKVDAAYYFGRPVAGSRTDFRIDYSKAKFAADGFAEFEFVPAIDRVKLPSRVSKRAKTDAAGHATWALAMPKSDGGGTMSVLVQASVQEPGGRAVSASQRATVYTWPYYLGLRSDWPADDPPRGPLAVSWVAVSSDGEPSPPHTLRYTLSRKDWQYTLSEDNDGDMAYRWEEELTEVASGPVPIGGHLGRLEIEPAGPGSYVLDVIDGEVGVSARMPFALWYGSGGGARPSHPANLVISSDRERYAPGGKAQLTFQSPTDGLAMVTTGSAGIDRSFAIPVQPGENVVEVVLPSIAQGCAYAAVTIVRAEGEQQLPRRLFGLARLELDQDAHAFAVDLALPEEARPGERIRVGVKLRAGDLPANAQVQLLLVDEGILALTRFASPEPFGFFHGERRCGLRFGDVYDQLFPETPERFSQIAAIGGGGDAGRYLSIASEVSKAAVLVLPPRAIEGNGEIEVTLPEHSGALRVMAVAFAADALGGANRELRMRDDLTLLLSGPQAVAPGDKFEITAQVTNHRAASELAVTMTLTGPLTVLDAPVERLTLPPGESTTFVARFEAQDAAGAASILLTVGEASERVSLVLRPPSPPVMRACYREIPAGQRAKIAAEGEWLAGTESLDLQISADPNVDARAALSWLSLYPYGCLEQTTSAVFPLAYADGIDPAFDAASLKQPIADTLARLQLMQTSRGGFAMWPGGQKPWFGGTVYACHFLTATQSDGALLDRALSYLASSVRQVRDDMAVEDRAYALYVLAAGKKPEHAVA
ncbi:MAG: hypothetical protein ACI8W8_003983, partial [Rhodothermales bacterium]